MPTSALGKRHADLSPGYRPWSRLWLSYNPNLSVVLFTPKPGGRHTYLYSWSRTMDLSLPTNLQAALWLSSRFSQLSSGSSPDYPEIQEKSFPSRSLECRVADIGPGLGLLSRLVPWFQLLSAIVLGQSCLYKNSLNEWHVGSAPRDPVWIILIFTPENRPYIYRPWYLLLSQCLPNWPKFQGNVIHPKTRPSPCIPKLLVRGPPITDLTVDPAAATWHGSNLMWLWSWRYHQLGDLEGESLY